MRVAYIAGPYRSDTPSGIYKNIQNARAIALYYWGLGYAVICPHMNTALFDGAQDDSVWMNGYIEIVKRCDVIVMTGDWRKSDGSIKELNTAEAAGLEVIYHSYS